jgi:hypothetical protein
LLAKSLFDSIDTKTHGGVRSSIENFLFYRVNSADDFSKSFVKICHSMTDASDYNKIIRAGLLDEETIDINTLIVGSSNILKCYVFFREKVNNLPIATKIQLFNNLFNVDRKMIVLVTLDENDVNEQSIFDSINRTGVRLNSADIIKNYLFQKCLDLCGDQKTSVIEIYNNYWGEYFYKNNGIENFWDLERSFGNNQRTNLEFLLYCVSIIEWGLTEKSFSDLPSVFKSKTEDYSYDDFVRLIKNIYEYAKIFYDKILVLQKNIPSDDPMIFSFKNYENRFLLMLEKFGVQMFYPYVLYSIRNSTNSEDLKGKLKKLESFIVRNRIAKKSVSDYSSKCSSLIHDPNRNSLIRNWFAQDNDLSDDGISNKLNDVKNDTAKMILFIIELYLRNSKNEDVPGLQYKLSLEHIMPQNWERSWKTTPIIDENGNKLTDTNGKAIPPTSDIEAENYRKSYINNIGNMTLLTSSLNSTLKDSMFEKKMGDGSKPGGYMDHSSLKITRFLINSYQKGDKVWDEAHIVERKRKLLNYILLIWPIN